MDHKGQRKLQENEEGRVVTGPQRDKIHGRNTVQDLPLKNTDDNDTPLTTDTDQIITSQSGSEDSDSDGTDQESDSDTDHDADKDELDEPPHKINLPKTTEQQDVQATNQLRYRNTSSKKPQHKEYLDEFSKEYPKEESNKKFDPPSTESPSSCSCPFILALLILIALLAFLLGFLGGSVWSSNRCLRSCMAELNGQRIAMQEECKDKDNLELKGLLKEMELEMRHLEKELNASKDESKRLHQSSRECTEDYDKCKDQKLTCLADLLKSQEDAKRKKEDLAAYQLEEVSKLQKGLEKKEEELEQCKEKKKKCEDDLEACLKETKKKEKECDEDKKECRHELSICLVNIKAIEVKLDACDKEKIECENKQHKKPCNKRRKHHHHHHDHHHHHGHHHHGHHHHCH
uniref:Uncharacterized protein n=1 Tax=Amphimedon queenslandica TaxID=400682 RepID=A0A1X7UXH5_AMPQE